MPLTAPRSSRSVAGIAVRILLAGMLALGSGLAVQAPASADSIRGQQWQLGFLRAQDAWKYSTGLGITVAVIDSGVDANHPDLRGQVLPGADFVDKSTDGRKDVVGHGTTVAALIAGKPDANGVMGLAYRSKILPIRVLDPQNKYDSADVVAKAVRYAVDRGARVINLSLGSADVAPVLSDALQYAFDHDVVVVACDGNVSNNRGTTVWHPAREPGVIAVSGVIRSGKFWTGSLQGPATVLSAPAADITGAHPGGDYWNVQGTSFASPLVAASAALVLAKYPKMSSADVINRLVRTAWDFGPKGRDGQFGFGIVNPAGALTANIPPVRTNPLLPSAPPPAAGGQAGPDGPGEPTGVAKPQSTRIGAEPFFPDSTFLLLALVCVGLIMIAVAVVVIALLVSIRRARTAGPPVSFPATGFPAPAFPAPGPPAGYPPDGFPTGQYAVPTGYERPAPPPPDAAPPPLGTPPVAPPPAAPPPAAPPPVAPPPQVEPTAPVPASAEPGPATSAEPAPAPPARRLGPWPPVWRRRPPGPRPPH
jgi:type VII secretion-associated serine protease mycosin